MNGKHRHILFLCFLIFCICRSHAQNVSTRVPFYARYNSNSLAKYLAAPCSTEEQKVQAFYLWITEHISYDVKRYQSGNSAPIKLRKLLIRKKGLCIDYANLFDAFCKSQGIKSSIVSGYSKGAINLEDDLLFISDHAWNAVFIGGSWRLLDLTWASGVLAYHPTTWGRVKRYVLPNSVIPYKLMYRSKRNDNYFLTSPKLLIETHLPENPIWQLLQPSLPIDVFEKGQGDISCYVNSLNIHQENALSFMELNISERILLSADSIVAFNCRNALGSGIERYKAGEGFYFEGAAKNDIHTLNKAFSCYDSSQKQLEESKLLIKEDANYRNKKNLTRNTLAKSYIKNAKNNFKNFYKQVNNIPSKDRARISNYFQKNRQIQSDVSLLSLKNIDKIKYKKRPLTPKEMEFNIYFNEIVKLNTDTLLFLSDEIVMMYKEINNQLLDSLHHLLVTVDKCFKRFEFATDELLMSRALRYSNLDSNVLLWCQKRALYSHELDSIMSIRIQRMNELKRIQNEMNIHINRMKKIARQSAQYIREIKLRSNVLGKEDSLYRAQFNQVIKSLIIIHEKNQSIVSYLKKQSDWAKKYKKSLKAMHKKLNSELRYENIRFESRSSLINRRYHNTLKQIGQLQKSANSKKHKIRTKIKYAQ